MSYFFLKYLILFLLSPIVISLLIILAGLFFLFKKKLLKAGKIIIISGCLVLFLGSLPMLPNFLLKKLERQYSPLSKLSIYEEENLDIQFVVVLSGDIVVRQHLPITSQYNYEGLVRLIEGIRLYRIFPDTKLILSGGISGDLVTIAEKMHELSLDLGIPKEDMILETKSKTTFEQAKYIKQIVSERRFILVTSASHMPRTMALFQKMEMNPIAAPTGHLVKQYGGGISILPSSLNLRKMEVFLYECLGTIKEKVLFRI